MASSEPSPQLLIPLQTTPSAPPGTHSPLSHVKSVSAHVTSSVVGGTVVAGVETKMGVREAYSLCKL